MYSKNRKKNINLTIIKIFFYEKNAWHVFCSAKKNALKNKTPENVYVILLYEPCAASHITISKIGEYSGMYY